MEKGQSFQQIILGKLDVHIQKNETGPFSPARKKFNQNSRTQSINCWKKHRTISLWDTGMSKDFWDKIPKAQETAAEGDKQYIKLKSFCTGKETISMERTYRMGENSYKYAPSEESALVFPC